MTYKEYIEDNKSPLSWWILTLERAEKLRVIVAQWDARDYKWYIPEPFEGRTETGYTNEVWFNGEDRPNWKVVDIR